MRRPLEWLPLAVGIGAGTVVYFFADLSDLRWLFAVVIGGGIYLVTMISRRVDALEQRLDRRNTNPPD